MKWSPNNDRMACDKWSIPEVLYELVNSIAHSFYRALKPQEEKVTREEAVHNMEEFVTAILRPRCLSELMIGRGFETYFGVKFPEGNSEALKQIEPSLNDKYGLRKAGKSHDRESSSMPLESRLSTLGDFYILHEEFRSIPSLALWRMALQYDALGMVPGKEEPLRDFAYRANSLLFIHKTFRKIHLRPVIDVDTDKSDVTVAVTFDALLVKADDLREASRRIPYHMDLSWIAAFIDPKSPFLGRAYGVCFTLPKYNGLNFILMRKKYASREKFLSILAHEMVHMGTVYLDTMRDFLETKAYIAGSAALGEYTIALNQRPTPILKGIKFLLDIVVRIPLPGLSYAAIPKVWSALKIRERRGVYNTVERRLQGLYGPMGNYIMGRLDADEVTELMYTNNIPARIALKNGVKWGIMRSKLRDAAHA